MNCYSVFILFILFCCSGCATIIHGKNQEVIVKTEPAGAQVDIDGIEAGETPLILTLPRKQDHVVNVSMEGYHAQTAHLKRSLSGTAIFYLLPGGLLSFGVDAANGAQYKLPESVVLVLKPLFDAETVLASYLASFKAMNDKLFIESESIQYQKLA
jgi:PEGA domain